MLAINREENIYRVELVQTTRLDTQNSGSVEQQLVDLFQEPGLEVILNLGAIRYIDKSGFRALLRIDQRARETRGRFKLCNVTEEVSELIILMEMEGNFSVYSCGNTEEKVLLVLE